MAGKCAALAGAPLALAQPRAGGELAHGRRRQRHLRSRRGGGAGHRLAGIRKYRNARPRLPGILRTGGRTRACPATPPRGERLSLLCASQAAGRRSPFPVPSGDRKKESAAPDRGVRVLEAITEEIEFIAAGIAACK